MPKFIVIARFHLYKIELIYYKNSFVELNCPNKYNIKLSGIPLFRFTFLEIIKKKLEYKISQALFQNSKLFYGGKITICQINLTEPRRVKSNFKQTRVPFVQCR